MKRQDFATLIRFSRVMSFSLLVVFLGGLLKPEAVAFGAAANHCAFYPGAYPGEALNDELKAYDTSKGTIAFKRTVPYRPHWCGSW